MAIFMLAGLEALAAKLPQAWTTVGHVKAAWELRVSGFPKDDMCAYFVLGDRNDLLEGTTPPRNPSASLGEQDLACWKYGVKNSTCVAFRVGDTMNFSQKWTLCLDSSAGASSKLDLTVMRIESSLPKGVQVQLLDAEGKIIADFSGATESISKTVQGVALGEYTLVVSYLLQTKEIEIAEGIVFGKGWNLISLPFNEILEAKIDGKALFGEYAVYRMDTSRHSFVQVASSDELEPGDGLWVYLPSGGTLTGRGKCFVGVNSTIPERESAGWKCLGVVMTCDSNSGATQPVAGILSTDSMRWDAPSMRFVSASGTPAGYVGYLFR